MSVAAHTKHDIHVYNRTDCFFLRSALWLRGVSIVCKIGSNDIIVCGVFVRQFFTHILNDVNQIDISGKR